MKTTLLIILATIILSLTHAQTLQGHLDVDLTTLVNNTVSNIYDEEGPVLQKELAIGDYVTFNFTIPKFTATPDSDADTVVLMFRPIFTNNEDGVAGAQITTEYPFQTVVSDASGTGTNYQVPAFEGIKFREDSTYTITITNTGTTVVYNRWFNINNTGGSVITNLNSDLFSKGEISPINPVIDGNLMVSLTDNIQSVTLELISMEGISVISKTITTTDNNIDVSGLKTGLYLLRDINSGSVTKLMIK